MTYHKIFSMCAAVVVTFVQFAVVAQPVSAKSRDVVVNAVPETITRRVSYADLNLATTPGQQTLNHRVGKAVEELCTGATGGHFEGLRMTIAKSGCANTAWVGARPQIANAVRRAQEIATTGSSSIAAAAITLALPH